MPPRAEPSQSLRRDRRRPRAVAGSAAARRWTAFLAGVLAILLLAFGAIPALQGLGPASEVRDAIRRSGIDATALFYSESEVACEAAAAMRDARTYSSPDGALSPEPQPPARAPR